MFAVDASSLRNQSVALDDVVGTRRRRHAEDETMLDAWIRSVEPDARAAVAVRLLRDHRVAEVADRIGTSARQLQRTMLTQVGLGPKTYQHVVRFRRFLAHAERGDALAVAAARAGYADQSHMSNEVRRLSATTPAALLAERGARS